MKILDFLALMRMDKPIGFMLLFWPCAFGVFLIRDHTDYPLGIDYILLVNFFLGAVLMRSAGCIINDIFDRDYDMNVQRTMGRPIASGRVSVNEALLLLAIILLLALIILINLAFQSIVFTLISVPLVIIYPLMKRFTHFPQVILGLTFNYGAMIAGIELEGYLSIKILILYVGCVFWTLGYDTIYGFMDIKDDKKINVKSLSILIENNHPRYWILLFYSVFYFLFILALYLSGHNFTHVNFLMLMLACLNLIWQAKTLVINSPENCMERFKSNNILGLLLILSMV